MSSSIPQPLSWKHRGKRPHPYLRGNFAPIQSTQPLTPCLFTGSIPSELFGGEYVRNGGNPVTNEDLGRDSHWFDGDGMLSGVAFRRVDHEAGAVQPEFVNQYVLTDLYLSTRKTKELTTPVLPSITTLVDPLSPLLTIIWRILRAVLLVILSHVWGSQQAIKRISVANTSILYHDGRALATCESGPPMRVALPGLETVGWFNGQSAEGELAVDDGGARFGGEGLLSFMKEWTTAHPRVDPATKELMLFHSNFVPPYVHYSIVPGAYQDVPQHFQRRLNAPVPGVSSPKMMHDFGVSATHTVILDLPLSLDPLNLARNKPVVSYDSMGKSRFGIFPRRQPENVRWFETDACCIFHTANTWDEIAQSKGLSKLVAVNMLACRLTSASVVFSAGNIAAPTPSRNTVEEEEEQCRLYYYQFDMANPHRNTIIHQWALLAIPFEFPSLRDDKSMSLARYIYGCSTASTFGTALGRADKIDSLVKVDTTALIERGQRTPPRSVTGCVDERTPEEILSSQDPNDPVKIFKMPPGWYAQEPHFVARKDGISEDDGWLLTYVFDESHLDEDGNAPADAKSELWIIDAKNMRDIVARVYLPQRVPYGLHGNWFSEDNVINQRPIDSIRSLPSSELGRKGGEAGSSGGVWHAYMSVRHKMLDLIG
ncbi:MAG: hypothetical protein M1833_003156 [Piccolia ochrophora]|nr:MAG: hypothetical protein M1833_003156 [Piccolia ochrophora]